MRTTKAIVSLVLAFVMIFGVVSPALAETEQSEEVITTESETLEQEGTETLSQGEEVTEQEGLEEVLEAVDESEEEADASEPKYTSLKDYIYTNGRETPTTQTFLNIISAIRTTKYILSGRIFFESPKTLNVTVSEDVIGLCEALNSQSALDVYSVLTNIPDVFEPAELIGKVFQIDVTEYRNEMYAKREEYNDQDNYFMANVCWFVGAYMSGVKSAYIYLTPYKDTGYQQITLDVTYSDGEVEEFHPGIYVNLETGECFGSDDKGMMNIGFNCNVYEAIVYAPIACWMKSFGFCVEYDILCYVLPNIMYNYRTRRLKFEYDDKEYMIQMWKGTYFITNGGEVGIYNREKGSVGSFYNVVSEEEQLDMSLQIWHQDDLLVNVTEQNHWWVNGFKLGYRQYDPNSLTLKCTMVVKDEAMLNAICDAIDSHYRHDISYTVDGLRLSFTW